MIDIDVKLTGRYYHKRTWLGLVLMVEYSYEDQGDSKLRTGWKRATEIDLLDLGDVRPNLVLFKAS